MAGLRVFFEAKFKMQAHPLTIRPVRPDPADNRKVTEDMVKGWAVQVLKQFESRDSHIAGVVTDGGTHVRGGLNHNNSRIPLCARRLPYRADLRYLELLPQEDVIILSTPTNPNPGVEILFYKSVNEDRDGNESTNADEYVGPFPRPHPLQADRSPFPISTIMERTDLMQSYIHSCPLRFTTISYTLTLPCSTL